MKILFRFIVLTTAFTTILAVYRLYTVDLPRMETILKLIVELDSMQTAEIRETNDNLFRLVKVLAYETQ